MATPGRHADATALIADDEPHLAGYLRELLAKAWPELEIVAVARNGVEAAERIAALRPRRRLPRHQDAGAHRPRSGARHRGRDAASSSSPRTTSSRSHAFEQQALDYVLKPVKAERLARAIERLQRGRRGRRAGATTRALASALQRLLPRRRRRRAGAAALRARQPAAS